MEYTNKQIETAKTIFGEGLEHYLLYPGLVQKYENANEIDMDFEMECFLDKYCVFIGDEEAMIQYFTERIKEEVERRLNYFQCETDEAKEFLRSCIEERVLNNTFTFYSADTFEASFHDVLDKKCYSYVGDQENYFVMDFSEADFTFDEFADKLEEDLSDIIRVAGYKYKEKEKN